MNPIRDSSPKFVTTHVTQYLKYKQPKPRKWAKDLHRNFSKDTDGQEAHEKMLNTEYYRNVNQN